MATAQLNYEGTKLKDSKLYVEFFEGSPPMTAESIKPLKEAIAINKQMSKQFRELRLANKYPPMAASNFECFSLLITLQQDVLNREFSIYYH